MNERDLILQALERPIPNEEPKKVKSMQEIEPSPFCEHEDAIWKMAKKTSQKHKTKPVTQWTNTDFIRYLNQLLSVYDLQLENYSISDANLISRLYDSLACKLDDMGNKILRDYIEWWVNLYGCSMHGKEIYVHSLVSDYYINIFLKKFDRDKDIEDYFNNHA